MSFDTGISQSDISKYIADFENDKKIFYNEWMICIVNFVKNQNIKVETDNLWIGIKREISEINQEKLIGMLNYKGLIRTLQGAYKVLDIPYLTLLNFTLLNSTWPDEVFEAPFVEEIQDTENTEDKNQPDTKKKKSYDYSSLENDPEDSFAKEAYLTLKKMWWNESIPLQEFIEYIDSFLVSKDISKQKWDFIKWQLWLKDFLIYWSNDKSTKKPNYLLKMRNSPSFTFNQKQYAKR